MYHHHFNCFLGCDFFALRFLFGVVIMTALFSRPRGMRS